MANTVDGVFAYLQAWVSTFEQHYAPGISNGMMRHGKTTRAIPEQVRVMNGAPSFLSTSELMVHFGLGPAETIDELAVRWSRGQVTVLPDVAANQRLTIAAPGLGDLDADGAVSTSDLLGLIALWGPADEPAKLAADLDADGEVGTADLLILLGLWG